MGASGDLSQIDDIGSDTDAGSGAALVEPQGGTSGSLAERVAALKWYHTIELPGGVVTKGYSDAPRIVSRLQLPESFAGKTVLDIGAWDGFYSFTAAQRGAKRVLATDSYSWSGESWGTKDGFLLAREALGLTETVEDQYIDVMDLSPEKVGGTFDVVLFLGVLYHLRDPITALDRVASVCDDLLVLETETAVNGLPWPAARVYPDRELNGDDTNWYAYNISALKGLLRRAGFGDVSVKYRTSVARRTGRVAKALAKDRNVSGLPLTFRSQRVVIHARR